MIETERRSAVITVFPSVMSWYTHMLGFSYLFYRYILSCLFVAMWGIQDKFLHLRVELDDRLKSENKSGALYRRWRWQQTQSNMEVSVDIYVTI